MKNKICFVALGVFLVLSFTACDNGNSAQTLNKETEETELNIETPSESEYDEGTLEEFFNNPINAYLLSDLNSSLEGEDSDSIYKDCKISFKGNRLIYEFYFEDNYGDMQNTVETSVKSGAYRMFDQLRTFFNPKDKMEVEIIYYNNDDTVAADVLAVEGEDEEENKIYESDAEPGTVECYYETYFGPDYWEDMAASTVEESEGIYSDIKIEINGNNVKYIYYLVSNVGDVQDIMAEEFTEEYMKYCVDQLKCPPEIKGDVYMEYIFYNPDGSVAASFSAQG